MQRIAFGPSARYSVEETRHGIELAISAGRLRVVLVMPPALAAGVCDGLREKTIHVAERAAVVVSAGKIEQRGW